MFERFTDRARRVIVLAQEEARLLGHGHIGTEHLLLGLLGEPQAVAARALESLDISLPAVRRQVEEAIGRGPQPRSGDGSIPFTPGAKRALELALREALRLDHNYIGTEHILLGVLREGTGPAATVLLAAGADLDRVRSAVAVLLAGFPAPEPTRLPEAPLTATLERLEAKVDALTVEVARLRAQLGPDEGGDERESSWTNG